MKLPRTNLVVSENVELVIATNYSSVDEKNSFRSLNFISTNTRISFLAESELQNERILMNKKIK